MQAFAPVIVPGNSSASMSRRTPPAPALRLRMMVDAGVVARAAGVEEALAGDANRAVERDMRATHPDGPAGTPQRLIRMSGSTLTGWSNHRGIAVSAVQIARIDAHAQQGDDESEATAADYPRSPKPAITASSSHPAALFS